MQFLEKRGLSDKQLCQRKRRSFVKFVRFARETLERIDRL